MATTIPKSAEDIIAELGRRNQLSDLGNMQETQQPVNVKLAYQVLQDKAASFWLKETVKRLLEKDIVDVRNELEVLNSIFGK